MPERFSMRLEWTETGYTLLENVHIFSERYQKSLFGFCGEEYDGATGFGVVDLNPFCFVPHDIACRDCCFADGTPITNRMASLIYYDQLRKYGISRTRASIRFLGTFFLGGKNLKKQNGWW